jgi:hypothetical protein
MRRSNSTVSLKVYFKPKKNVVKTFSNISKFFTFRSNKKIKTHKKKYKRRGGSKSTTLRIKDMACSPLVNGKQVIQKSCYTADALIKIKKYYNKKNVNDQITTNDPVELWRTLKHRMVECRNKKEDCWLTTIDDKKLRKELDEDIFAPDHPPEWTKNPHEWLSNFDILKVLKQYEKAYPEFSFIEPSPIDFDKKPINYTGRCVSEELCTFSIKDYMDKNKTKIGFIFNLDDHTKGGSHWVSMFLDLDDKFIFFFNSTGEPIPREIEALKDRIIKQAEKHNIHLTFIQNHPTSHQRGNNECGMYSLFFIITMLSMPGITKPIQKSGSLNSNIEDLDKVRMFKGSSIITDSKMSDYRKLYFNSP